MKTDNTGENPTKGNAHNQQTTAVQTTGEST